MSRDEPFDTTDISVLFVCLGNICRSPLAEGVFRHLAIERANPARLSIDSAGTGGWHVGHPPDPRSQAVARRHGILIETQKARRVSSEDFSRFDLIVAMDGANLRDLEQLRPSGAGARLARLRDWDPEPGDGDVPDPYYGGPDGFDQVYAMIDRSCRALLDDLLDDPLA